MVLLIGRWLGFIRIKSVVPSQGRGWAGDHALVRTQPRTRSLDVLNVSLERDLFLRILIRELSGTHQDVVGMSEASGFSGGGGSNATSTPSFWWT
jgi:hypothetical protein